MYSFDAVHIPVVSFRCVAQPFKWGLREQQKDTNRASRNDYFTNDFLGTY
jgi:hypothetical protein